MLEKEQSVTTRVIGRLKMGLYRTSYIILGNTICTRVIYELILVLELSQLLLYPFKIGMEGSSGSSEFRTIHEILEWINLVEYIKELGYPTIVALVVIVQLIRVLIIMFFLLMDYFTKKIDRESYASTENFNCTFKAIGFLITLRIPLLSFPFFAIMLAPFNCRGQTGAYYFVHDYTQPCWQGSHIALVILTAFYVSLEIIIAALICSLITETFPYSKIPWASSTANKHRFLSHISVMVLISFQLLDHLSVYFHYAFMILLFLQMIILYILLKSPPHLHFSIHVTVILMHSFYFFYLLLMYAMRILCLALNYYGFLFLLGLTIFLPILVLYIKQLYSSYLLKQNPSTMRSSQKLLYYFTLILDHLIKTKRGNSKSKLLLYGVMINHQSSCRNSQCGCCSYILNENIRGRHGVGGGSSGSILSSSHNQSLADASFAGKDEEEGNEDENQNGLVQFILKILEHQLTINSRTVVFRMLSSFYYRSFLGNLFKSAFDILYAKEILKPNFTQSFQIYQYIMIIEDEIKYVSRRTNIDRDIDVETLIDFEFHYEQMNSQAEIASNLVFNFWQQLTRNDFNINELYRIGSHVSTSFNKLERNFHQSLALFPQNSKLIIEFANFQEYIMNNKIEAHSLRNRAEMILREDHDQNQDGDLSHGIDLALTKANCIIVISGNPISMGKILSCNSEIKTHLGFKSKEIVGHSLNIIIPPAISKRHNEIMESYMKIGSNNLNINRIVTAQNKKGFLVKVQILIKSLSTIQDGIKYLVILKKVDNFAAFFPGNYQKVNAEQYFSIATNLEGTITGITEMGLKKFGIPASLFNNSTNNEEIISINTLLPDITEPDVQEGFLTEQKKVTFDSRPLKYSINRENLSKRESYHLEHNTSKREVVLKIENQKLLSKLLNYKVYQMIIEEDMDDSSTNAFFPRTKTSGRATSTVSKSALQKLEGMSSLFRRERKKEESESEEEKEKTEGGVKKSRKVSVPISDSKSKRTKKSTVTKGQTLKKDEYEKSKSLQEFKNCLKARQSSGSIKTLNRLVTGVMLILLIMGSISLYFLLAQRSLFLSNISALSLASKRFTNVPLIQAQIYYISTIVNNNIQQQSLLNQEESQQGEEGVQEDDLQEEGDQEEEEEEEEEENLITEIVLDNVDFFQFLREANAFAKDVLGEVQKDLDFITFDYQPTLKALENDPIVNVYNLNMERQQNSDLHTVNIAITQYIANAAGVESYDYLSFKETMESFDQLQAPHPLEENLFFIMENGLRDFLLTVQEAKYLYLSDAKKQNEKDWVFFLVAEICISLILILCPIYLFPKLIDIQKNKFNILVIYAKLSNAEIKTQLEKCLEYQKIEGYTEIGEDDKSDQSEDYSKILEEEEQLFLKENFTDNSSDLGITERLKSPSPEDSFSDQSSSSQNSSSKDESSEFSEYDSNSSNSGSESSSISSSSSSLSNKNVEKEKLKEKLKTNKLGLLILVILISLTLESLFLFNTIYTKVSYKEANTALENICEISGMYSSPLNLISFTLVSTLESRTFPFLAEDLSDIIPYFLNDIMLSNTYYQHLQASEHSFLQNTKSILQSLDSNEFCAQTLNAIANIQTHYSTLIQQGISGLDFYDVITLQNCIEFDSGILERGLTNALFRIYQEANKVQALREISAEGIDVEGLLQSFRMLVLFLTPVFESLVILIQNDCEEYFQDLVFMIVLMYVAYVIVVLLCYFVIWKKYLNKMMLEIIRSKSMLNIMPEEFMLKLQQESISSKSRKRRRSKKSKEN